MQILDREISRVFIIDDDPEARESFTYTIEDLELEPVEFTGPISSANDLIGSVESTDAILCDLHLKQRDYSTCDGHEILEACYNEQIPGVLCTTFTDAGYTINRKSLRFIPAFLRTSSPSPDVLMDAFTKSLAEMNGTFHPTRQPWRTQIRIEEVDPSLNYVYAVVPAWDVRKKIRIDRDVVPEQIYGSFHNEKIVHAKVNIGAESYEELFFVSWEPT